MKVEQFQLAKSQDGKCSSDSFSISTQQCPGRKRVNWTGLLCGQKTVLESNEKETSHGKHVTHDHYVSVLLPVTQGFSVFFNFDMKTDEAAWRLKIANEDCSENIAATLFGEIRCQYDTVY